MWNDPGETRERDLPEATYIAVVVPFADAQPWL
jgi:hypothetical protein